MNQGLLFFLLYLVIGLLLGTYSVCTDIKTGFIKKQPDTSFGLFIIAWICWFPLFLAIGIRTMLDIFGDKENHF